MMRSVQRTALPDQCLHSAEPDVRPPRRKSGFGPPIIDIGRSLSRTAANKKYRLVCRQPKPNQVILILYGARPAPPRRLLPQTKRSLWLRRRRRRKGRKRSERRSRALLGRRFRPSSSPSAPFRKGSSMTKLMSKSELIQKVADQHSLSKKEVKGVITTETFVRSAARASLIRDAQVRVCPLG